MASSRSARELKPSRPVTFRVLISTENQRRSRCASSTISRHRPDECSAIASDAALNEVEKHLEEVSTAAAALITEEPRPPKNVTVEKTVRQRDGRGQLGESRPPLQEFRLPAPNPNPMRRWRPHRSFMTSVGGRLIIVLLAVLAYLALIKLPLPSFSDRQAGDRTFDLTGSSPVTAQRNEAEPRLIVHGQQGSAGEPLPLGITMQGSAEGAVVIIRGIIPGMIFSSGSATGADTWQVPTTQLANTWIGPPSGFVGTLDLVAELQLDGAALGSPQAIRIEWITASSAIAAQGPTATPVREPIPQIATTPPVPEVFPSPPQLATTMPLAEPVPSPRQLESEKIKTEQPGEQT